MTPPATGAPQRPAARRRIVEPAPPGPRGPRAFVRNLSVASAGSALVAAIFGCTGPALIIIDGASANGLSPEQTATWIFGVYVFGGLISLVLATSYRQPVVGAYSIPGAVLAVGALGSHSFAEMAGAYVVAALLVLVLGLSGAVRRVMSWLPLPIIMAMIAGALINFAVGVLDAGREAPWIVAAAVAGFLVSTRFLPRVPGVLGALVCGAAAAAATGAFGAPATEVALTAPQPVVPGFDAGAVLAVSVPLAVLIVGAENAQAIGVLITERYRPPMNAMTIASGVFGLLASPFGAHSANIAGPMTAICAAPGSGPRAGRYTAAVVNGVLFAAFGVLAGAAVGLVTALPSQLISAVAGLAMVTVLVSALQRAFSGGRFQIGAFFALVIAMSGVTAFGISAPFWALVGGVLASLVLETGHFRGRDREGALGADETDGHEGAESADGDEAGAAAPASPGKHGRDERSASGERPEPARE
ncbi:benzoate/H(+) symporter BenE family transporter [Streptomonospora arabica]|uniref:Benzoate/H(+) symporter BenE family transporter n=1 Tax=Streptomonospora arabica TaxID=412417 RepID=A0ABV9SHU7_9ACTN